MPKADFLKQLMVPLGQCTFKYAGHSTIDLFLTWRVCLVCVAHRVSRI